MKASNIISLCMLYFKLNNNKLHGQPQAVLKEGMEVINTLSNALSDGKITMAEKKILVKELRDFSKVSIKLIEDITIPEPKKTKK